MQEGKMLNSRRKSWLFSELTLPKTPPAISAFWWRISQPASTSTQNYKRSVTALVGTAYWWRGSINQDLWSALLRHVDRIFWRCMLRKAIVFGGGGASQCVLCCHLKAELERVLCSEYVLQIAIFHFFTVKMNIFNIYNDMPPDIHIILSITSLFSLMCMRIVVKMTKIKSNKKVKSYRKRERGPLGQIEILVNWSNKLFVQLEKTVLMTEFLMW